MDCLWIETDGVDGLICIFNFGEQILCLRFEEDRVDRFLLTLLLRTLALDSVSGEKKNNIDLTENCKM